MMTSLLFACLAKWTPPVIQLGFPLPAEFNRPLTASEAVKIALVRQPLLAVRAANFLAARGRTGQAGAAERPGLNLNSGYSGISTIQNRGSGGTTTSGFANSLTVNQLLFDFNVTRDQVRQATALEQAQGQALSVAEADVALQVKQAFYGVHQADRLIDVAQANLASRTAQLVSARARVNAGLGAPPDVVRAQSAEDDATIQLVQARTNASLTRVALAQAMGIDPRTPLLVADTQEAGAPSDDLASLVEQALRQRPEIIRDEATLRAAGFGVRIARKATTPAVSANAGLTSRGESDPSATVRSTFGFTLTWSLFDGGLVAGRVREAKANEIAAKATVTQTIQTVIAEVSVAYLNLKTAEQRLALSASAVTNAQESVRLAEGRYKGGVGTFLEVTDAQATLVAAKTNQVNAATALQTQRATLQHAIGALK